MEGIQIFKGSWPWPWIRPYGIPSCITHRPLPTYQISFKSKKLFADGRTYGRTDIFSPSNIIRSTFGSRPKNQVNAIICQRIISIIGYLQQSKLCLLTLQIPRLMIRTWTWNIIVRSYDLLDAINDPQR